MPTPIIRYARYLVSLNRRSAHLRIDLPSREALLTSVVKRANQETRP